MKKTSLLLAAALFTLTFTVPPVVSAQSSTGGGSIPNPYASAGNTNRNTNATSSGALQNPYVNAQGNSTANSQSLSPDTGGTALTNPYRVGDAFHGIHYARRATLNNPYGGGGTNLGNSYQAVASPKTAVAVKNHSHRPLTIYLRWNDGVAQPFQIQPQQVLIESIPGHNQTAELVFHEDLTGNSQIPKTLPLAGENVTLNRAPVASDIRWVKDLHVTYNRVSATY